MSEDDIIFKRDELYKQVWETPMCRLASSYGLSDVGLKKICKKLNIPTPPRGYWAKREYGYKVDRIPLPKKVYDQHVTHVIDKYAIDKRNKKTEIEGHRYIPEGIDLSKPIIVAQKLLTPHPLVQRVKALCEDDEPDKYGVVWPCGKEVFDIRVSPQNLSRALRILDCIVKWFEDNGFDFSESNGQFPKALLTVHGETMKFAIHEKVNRIDHIPTKKELEEQKKWSFMTPRLWDYESSGKLSIMIDDWNSNGIQKKWSDTAKRKIEETINSFVTNIFQIAYFKHLKRLEQEEKERQWQLERKRQNNPIFTSRAGHVKIAPIISDQRRRNHDGQEDQPSEGAGREKAVLGTACSVMAGQRLEPDGIPAQA